MKRIAVDIDEVLTPFLPTMLKWRRPLKVPPRYPYRCSTLYGISEIESQKLIQEFYKSDDFMNLKPFQGSKQVLGELSEYNKLYVVTGRQDSVRLKTETWIEKWYPGVFTDVILTNSFTDGEVSKSSICKILNIGLIIDDNFDTCMDCINNGIRAINFIGDPVYPWCQESEISMRRWMPPPQNLTQ